MPRKPRPYARVNRTEVDRSNMLSTQTDSHYRYLRFVSEYVKDLNGTQAAIRAGYSPTHAKRAAWALLSDPEIRRRIGQALAARAERLQVDTDWVLNRLVQEAEADMSDLFREDGSLKPVREWPTIWRQGLVSGIKVREEKLDGVPVATITEVKLSDRIKRIEMIGKHVDVGAFMPDPAEVMEVEEQRQVSARELAKALLSVISAARIEERTIDVTPQKQEPV